MTPGKGVGIKRKVPVQALCRPHPCGLHVHGPCVGAPAGSALLTDTPAPGQGAVIRGNQPHAEHGAKFPPQHNPVIQTPEREKVIFKMTVLPTHARQCASILPVSHRKVTSHIQPAFLEAVTWQRRDPSQVVSEQITLNTRDGQTCANVPAVPTCRHYPSPDRQELPCIPPETSRSLLRALTGTQKEERSCTRFPSAPVSENKPVPHPGQVPQAGPRKDAPIRLVDSTSGKNDESNGAGALTQAHPCGLWACLRARGLFHNFR